MKKIILAIIDGKIKITMHKSRIEDFIITVENAYKNVTYKTIGSKILISTDGRK